MVNTTRSYASLWVRTIAFAFDYLLIALYLIAITMLSLLVYAVFPDIQQIVFGTPVSGQITSFIIITLPVTVYFALLESSAWQSTWGKRRAGLQVIDSNGERLSRSRALGRTVLKFIPWELAHTCIWQLGFAPQEPSSLITIGFVLVWLLVGANVISMWFDTSHQTVYDRLMRTYVVTA